MKLAVIPARGGSKRIPRKNVRLFHGKPMIAWTIEAAASSGCFDRILVSTDDRETIDISRGLGAEVLLRPGALADDYTPTSAVVAHAIEFRVESGDDLEAVCCLYATAPMLMPEDIRRGLEILQASDCEYVFAASRYPFPIQRAFRIDANGRASMFYPEQFAVRSQDLEEAFHDAAQFYWARPATWLRQLPVFSSASIPVVLPGYRVLDIDTAEDWTRAEIAFETVRAMERV